MVSKIIDLLFLILICCLMTGARQAVATQSAEAVVKQTTENVLYRINNERSMLAEHPEKIYDLVDELIIPHFDFLSMSRWVLGKHWKAATKTQRAEFVDCFKTLLIRSYARALLEYSDQEIKYFPIEQNPNSNLAVIKTELTNSDSKSLPIVYRMHQKNKEWKVVDVVIDGVSLVSTYRGSFSDQIKKSGLDSLIKYLNDKNTKLD